MNCLCCPQPATTTTGDGERRYCTDCFWRVVWAPVERETRRLEAAYKRSQEISWGKR